MHCEQYCNIVVALMLLFQANEPATHQAEGIASLFARNKQVSLPTRVSIQSLALVIELPGDFVEARVVRKGSDSRAAESTAIALVESARLGERDPQNLRVGEIPMIVVERVPPPISAAIRQHLEDKWKTQIGHCVAFKLPNAPAPFGENLHAYLVEDSKAGDLLFVATKFSDVSGSVPTHYDWVIERVIGTLTLE
jgi:hypothetical protein